MIVQVNAGGATIVEPDDCHRLHVAASPNVDVASALEAAGLGRLSDTGDALLIIAELRGLAADGATDEGWPAAWESMIDYAAAKGWVTADGREVRAHVERA